MPVRAHVSYSWGVEQKTNVVAAIQDLCRERKIELVLDKERVQYGDSIPNFMHEIGKARWVFVVLSPEYLRSPYCMFELSSIFKQFEDGRSILPVLIERDWISDANRNALLADLGQHWHEQAEKDLEAALAQVKANGGNIALNQQRWALAAGEIFQGLSRFVEYFSERNLPGILPLPSSHLQALVESIPRFRTLRDDSEFVNDVRARIAQTFDSKSLAGLLKTQLERSDFAGEASITDALLKYPEVMLDQVIAPAYRELRGVAEKPSPAFEAVWEQAKEMIGLVVVLAVRKDWLAKSGLDASTDSQFDIAVRTAFGVEVVSARLRQKVPRRLVTSASKSDVHGQHAIVPPTDMPASWGNGSDVDAISLQRVLVTVWNAVFEEERKDDHAGLVEFEIEKLNGRLAKREKIPGFHHYLFVSLACENPGSRRVLVQAVAEKLPSLAIILMGFEKTDANIFSSGEVDLMNSVAEFLQIPYVY
jgi:hypothetical protein